MADKPTYEGLEQRIKELEREPGEKARFEDRLQIISLAISQSSEGIAMVDLDGNLEYLNASFATMHGYCPEEIIGKNLSIFHSPEQLPSVDAANRQIKETGDFKGEIWHIRRDGTEFPTMMHNSLIKDAEGKPIGMLATLRDITESKQAEEAMRQQKDFAESLLDTAQAIVLVLDKRGRIVRFNPYMVEISGYQLKEVQGKDWFNTFIPQKDHAQLKELFLKAIGNIQTRGNVNPIITKDGQEVYVEWYDKALNDADGNVTGLLSIGQDISNRKQAEEERKKLEAQLHQSERMEAIGTLAGGIAHDFNNILAAIIGYAELAKMHMPEGSLAQANLNEVLTAGKRAKDLVRQMLTFSRQSEAEQKPLEINTVVKEALELLRASIPTTVEIQKDIKKESATVMADPTQIHQVLMNLCTNAAFAMKEDGGILGICLENIAIEGDAIAQYPDLKPGPYVRLTVSDTGPGIKETVKARIFDPFFTTKGPGEGTGMGLSVVHGIVKNHGGMITVYSEPGRGATFHVLLPRIEGEIASEAQKVEPLPTGTERILLVDDEEALVNMGEQILKRLGYEVVARTSSVEALEAFRTQPDKFNLVITDLTMPNMTGKQLAKELVSIRSDIPIILCTGYSQIMSNEQIKSAGIDGFIMKPMVMRELAETIRRVLDEEKGK